MLQLTFNPGLTLTGFRTTRPWCLRPVTSQLRHSLVVHPLLKKILNLPHNCDKVLRIHRAREDSGQNKAERINAGDALSDAIT